jgi:hypothetical protein
LNYAKAIAALGKIPLYGGRKREEVSPQELIEYLEQFQKLTKITDEFLINILVRYAFDREALSWYNKKFESTNSWTEFKKDFKEKFETVGFHKVKLSSKAKRLAAYNNSKVNQLKLNELILKLKGLTDKVNVLLEKRSFKGEDGSPLLEGNTCDDECSEDSEMRPLAQFGENPFVKDEGGGYKTELESSINEVEIYSCTVRNTDVDIEPLVEVKVLNQTFLALLWTGTSFSRIGPEIISLVSLLNIPVTKRLCLNHGIETLEDTVNLSIDFGGIKLKETFILTENMNYSLALGWNYMCFRNINLNSNGWSIGNPGDCPLQEFSVSTMCVSEGDVNNRDVTGEELKVHVSSEVTLLARDVSQCPPGRPLGTEVTSANTSSDMAGSTKYEFDSFDLEPDEIFSHDFEHRECDIDISFLFNCNEVKVRESNIKLQQPKVYEDQVQVIQGVIKSEFSKLRCREPMKRNRSKSPSTSVPFKRLKVDIPYSPLEILNPYPTDSIDLSFPCVKFRVFKKSKIKFTSGMSSVKRDEEFRKRKKLRGRYPLVKDKVISSKYSLNGRLFSNCFKRSHFRQDIRVPWKLNQI